MNDLTININPVTSDVDIALHGNNIIRINDNIIYVCHVTPATKEALVASLGGSFNGNNYFINGRAIEMSRCFWYPIND